MVLHVLRKSIFSSCENGFVKCEGQAYTYMGGWLITRIEYSRGKYWLKWNILWLNCTYIYLWVVREIYMYECWNIISVLA